MSPNERERVAVCLFTKNERAGCEMFLKSTELVGGFDLFCIDAGSTDGTVELLESAGVKVISQTSRGYSGAYLDALTRAESRPLIIFHPKGTVEPGILGEMRKALEDGFDLVIAGRMVAGGRNADDDSVLRHRKFFGIFAGWVLWLRFSRGRRVRVRDPLHGLRGFSRVFQGQMSLAEGSVTADLDIVRQAYLHGASIREIPVSETARSYGKTNFPTFKTGLELIKFLFRVRY